MTSNKSIRYYIVQFFEEETINGKPPADIVPSKWISLDEDLNLVTKFMPPPFTKKKKNVLDQMVSDQYDAPTHWKTYKIKKLFGAETFAEAETNLSQYENGNYCFSTDCEAEEDIHKNLNPAKNEIESMEVTTLEGDTILPPDSDSSRSDSDDQPSTSKVKKNVNLIKDKSNLRNRKKTVAKKSKASNHNNLLQTSSKCPTDDENNEQKITRESKPTRAQPQVRSITVFSDKDKMKIFEVLGLVVVNQENIQRDVKKLSHKLDNYIQMNKKDDYKNGRSQWMTQNNLKWPLKKKEDFDLLGDLLSTNEEIENDLKARMDFIIDCDINGSKNILAIVRKFLHQDLANKFTVVKPVAGKELIKPTSFYKCMRSFFEDKNANGELREKMNETLFDKYLGTVLTNSKSWNKGIKQLAAGASKEKDEDDE